MGNRKNLPQHETTNLALRLTHYEFTEKELRRSRLDPSSGVPPYGDQPEDNDWIKKGIEYNKEYPVSNGPGPCG
jgi:hypothetical protein